ncbi:MAG: hypothetical protein HOM21_03870 [Halobacteriovoraceae bacterium]|nr:hypothetical protein [Halobacteriovoraceae bacterium]
MESGTPGLFGLALNGLLILLPLDLSIPALWIMLVGGIFLLLNLYLVKLVAGKLSGQSFFVVTLAMFFTLIYFPLWEQGVGGVESAISSCVFLGLFYFIRRVEEEAWPGYLKTLYCIFLIGGLVRWENIFCLILLRNYLIYSLPIYSKSEIGKKSLIFILAGASVGYIVPHLLLGFEVYKLSYLLKGLSNIFELLVYHLYPLLIFSASIFLIKGDEFTLKPMGQRVFKRDEFFCWVGVLFGIFIIQWPVSLITGELTFLSGGRPGGLITSAIPCLGVVAALGLNQIRRSFGTFVENTTARRIGLVIFFFVMCPPLSGIDFMKFVNGDFRGEQKSNILLGRHIKKNSSNSIIISVGKTSALPYYSKRRSVFVSPSLTDDEFSKLLKNSHVDLFTTASLFSKKQYTVLYHNDFRRISNGPFFKIKTKDRKIYSGFWTWRNRRPSSLFD